MRAKSARSDCISDLDPVFQALVVRSSSPSFEHKMIGRGKGEKKDFAGKDILQFV